MQAILASARRTTEAIEKNTASVTDLAAKLEEAGKQLNLVPRMLEAIVRTGSAQLQIMQQQAEPQEQARPRGSLFRRANGPMPPRDVETANFEAEVAEFMRAEGITRDEALLRMNTANGRSVWEGDMFAGWKG